MNMQQFFERVLPEEEKGNYYCVTHFSNTFHKGTEFRESKQDIVDIVKGWENSKNPLTRQTEKYIGMASLSSSKARNQQNAVSNKSLFIDIDCKGLTTAKEGKEYNYDSKEKALKDLNRFLQVTGLPKPLILDSGYGLHVHWVLSKSIPSVEWKTLATSLKRLTHKYDLHNDRGLSTNEVCLLRIPETHNYKNKEDIKEVKVIQEGDITDVDKIEPLLQGPRSSEIVSKLQDKIKDSATTILAATSLGANIDFSFKKIVNRSMNGTGCNHIKYMLENPNKVSEPYWRAGISIAAFCVEEEDAVKQLSEGYANYDEAEALGKMERLLSTGAFAYKCTSIDSIAPPENKHFCVKCKHKDKIGSPIKLGAVLPQAQTANKTVTEINAETEETVTYNIPSNEDLPLGYINGNTGAVLKAGADEDSDPILVYPQPLYAVKRLDDPLEGQALWVRLHTTLDGIREFMIPYTTLSSTEECKKFLAAKGILAPLVGQQRSIQQYLIEYANLLRDKQKLEELHVQFGWKEDYKKFVIGVKELDGEGINYTPPASTMTNLLDNFERKGNLEEWKETFNLYNKPGYEPQAFTLMSAFGSPLLEFTDTKGVIIHLTSSDSGAGKTTIQRFINSVYGNPDMGLNQTDTRLSSFHTFGVLRNLPFCIDEVTNMDASDASDLAYAITHGRARNRMSASSNKLRENKFTWKSILVTTGNASFYDKLAEKSQASDGEMMRVFEIRVPSNSSTERQDDRFSNVGKNYGYAGEVYIQHVLKNIDSVKNRVMETKEKLRVKLGLSSKERFWADTFTVNIVGGQLAKEVNLHNYDMDNISRWLQSDINTVRRKTTISKEDLLGHIGTYINQHSNNIIVINAKKTNGLQEAPLREPKAQLSIRIEPDTERLYFAVTHFRSWCARMRVPYADVIIEAEKRGVLLSTKKKRLGTGSEIQSASVGVNCHEFDSSLLMLDDLD